MTHHVIYQSFYKHGYFRKLQKYISKNVAKVRDYARFLRHLVFLSAGGPPFRTDARTRRKLASRITFSPTRLLWKGPLGISLRRRVATAPRVRRTPPEDVEFRSAKPSGASYGCCEREREGKKKSTGNGKELCRSARNLSRPRTDRARIDRDVFSFFAIQLHKRDQERQRITVTRAADFASFSKRDLKAKQNRPTGRHEREEASSPDDAQRKENKPEGKSARSSLRGFRRGTIGSTSLPHPWQRECTRGNTKSWLQTG